MAHRDTCETNTTNDGILVSDDEFEERFTITYAQISWLKAEYTSILIKSITNEETTKIMAKNPSCFMDIQMKHLQYTT